MFVCDIIVNYFDCWRERGDAVAGCKVRTMLSAQGMYQVKSEQSERVKVYIKMFVRDFLHPNYMYLITLERTVKICLSF